MEDWKKNLEKRIKKSADEIEIPDRLQPEEICRQLERNGKNKSRSRWQWMTHRGLAVAALVAVMLVSTGAWRLWKGSADVSEYAGEAVSESAEAAREETGVKEQEKEYTKGQQRIGEFYTAQNHRTVKKRIEKAWEEQEEKNRDQVMYEYDTDAGGEAAAEGGAVPESSPVIEESIADDSAESGAEYSGTNLQVAGVDEGDVVKTDGTCIYSLSSDGRVRIVDTKKLELISEFSAETEEGEVTWKEMYIDGKYMMLVGDVYRSRLEESSEKRGIFRPEIQADYAMVTDRQTVMHTYELTDLKAPKCIGEILQSGEYYTSRKIGDLIYLFSNYWYSGEEEMSGGPIIPLINGEEIRDGSIYVPEELAGCQYLVMTSVNLKNPNQTEDEASILDQGNQFHITKDSIYVMQNDWSQRQSYTHVIRFAMEGGEFQGIGAASLKGELTDLFAVNEYDGTLRILLTDWSSDNGPENRVYVLDQKMKVIGKIENIARGEQIYSARFMGDRGYFVTYRNVDPLFTVDFSDPKNPAIVGELKITGFSDYLHFYGENRMLGIGWETDPETGEQLGLKLSMFDISDPSQVEEEKKLVIKNIDICEGLLNYKAFLVDDEKNLIGFPITNYDPDRTHEQYLVFSYDKEKGFQKELQLDTGKLQGYGGQADRTRGLYIGDMLYVAEENKIRGFDMKNDFQKAGSLELH